MAKYGGEILLIKKTETEIIFILSQSFVLEELSFIYENCGKSMY